MDGIILLPLDHSCNSLFILATPETIARIKSHAFYLLNKVNKLELITKHLLPKWKVPDQSQ